jgi:Leucine-rich repeat (LRR) protein
MCITNETNNYKGGNTMLKVATIGIGNCGGQISELAFTKYQIPGLAINSSNKDLENISVIKKMLIGDEKGAGKNRDEAKTFVKKKIMEILDIDEFVNHFSSVDVMFMISSTGGGTGSGMTPMMTDILSRKFPKTNFIIVEILPPLRESLGAQQNTIEYLNEVDKLTNVTYMSYDNNRFNNLSTSEMMLSINNEIVDHMAIIRGDYQFSTPFNSIDEKDMLRIITTPGRLSVYGVSNIKEKDLDDKSVEDMILEEIKIKSSNVELDRNKLVKRLGIITSLNEKLNTEVSPHHSKLKEFVGEPIESFEHVHISQDSSNTMILLLSGLSIPNDRIEKISQRIDEGLKELLAAKQRSVLSDIDVSEIKDIRNTNVVTNEEFDLEELFGKY